VTLRRSLLGLTSLLVVICAGVPVLSTAKGGPCSPRAPQYCPAPKVKTGPAKHVTSTSATLTGTVNPNGSATSCYFEYGRTRLYGSTTAPQNAGSGTKPVKVSATIDGLAPSTIYHYQLVCHNLGGQGTGGDKSFKTRSEVTIRASRTVLVSRRGRFTVRLQCSANHACAGTLTLTGSGGKRLAHPVHYDVRPHSTVPVHMVLTASARRRLTRRHHLAGRLRARDVNGSAASRRVRLRRRQAHQTHHG
jgi:hypothetical protein